MRVTSWSTKPNPKLSSDKTSKLKWSTTASTRIMNDWLKRLASPSRPLRTSTTRPSKREAKDLRTQRRNLRSSVTRRSSRLSTCSMHFQLLLMNSLLLERSSEAPLGSKSRSQVGLNRPSIAQSLLAAREVKAEVKIDESV